MFTQRKPPQKKQIKLGLDSDISINLIDVVHLDLHPSFIRPAGNLFIQAIGEFKREGDDNRNTFNVYAENNENNYLIEIESVEDRIEQVTLYQNVLTLTPQDPHEWEETLKAITVMELDLDKITFTRSLGGNSERASLCEFEEVVKSKTGVIDCKNQVMLYERKIEPDEFIEKLKVIVEVMEIREQASISFYVGFGVHPSMITILGN